MIFKIKITMRYIIFIISFISLISCKSEINNKLKLTNYIGKLEIEKDKYLPFNFSVINDSVLVVKNSSELVEFSIEYSRDSIFINSKYLKVY